MAFLDRLLADVLGNATGLPVRGLVRRVGAGNLLLLGGAAVAGGLIADAMARQQRAGNPLAPQPGTNAVPPPLPPLPPLPQVAPPELPPIPESPLPPSLQLTIVRTMVAAALADGRLSDDERSSIRERLAESDLDDAAIAQVRAELTMPASPEELAASAEDASAAAAVYRAAWLVTRSDRTVEGAETVWLDRLATALGFDAARREALASELENMLRRAALPDPVPAPPENETR